MKKALFVTGILLGLAVFAAFTPGQAVAEPPPQNKLLEIPPGITTADLNGDEDHDHEVIVNMWVDRIQTTDLGYHLIVFLNASTVPFQEIKPLQAFQWPQDTTNMEYWQDFNSGLDIIAIEPDEGGRQKDRIITRAHDGCMMNDYRLLYIRQQPFLISAHIDTEMWTCGEGPVIFKVYKVVDADEMESAVTEQYFKVIKKWKTDKRYRNVTEAFKENEKKLINIFK